jgi:hypothetical protein
LEPSIKLNVSRLRGVLGAIQGAKTADAISTIVMKAASIVSQERVNEYQISESSMRLISELRSKGTAFGASAVLCMGIPLSRFACDPDAGINRHIEQINNQVDRYEQGGHQQQVSRHDRNIHGLNRL